MQTILLIINAPGYGSENAYDALRLGRALIDEPETKVRIFCIGDAVVCAKKGQKTPDGYYNIGKMLSSLVDKDVEVGVCGTCIEARGIDEKDLLDGVHKGNVKELVN